MSAAFQVAPDATTRPTFDPSPLLEGLFASLVLFVATGGVFPLLRRLHGEGTVTVGASGPEGQIYAFAFAAAALLIQRYRDDFLAVVRRDRILWCIPLLALVSVAWSTDPGQSLRSAVSLFGCMLFGSYLALRFGSRGLLNIVALTAVVSIALSLAFIFVPPQLGIDVGPHAGAWRGAYSHKNMFGRTMALAVATFATFAVYRSRTRFFALPLIALAATGVVLSQSRTSLITAGGALFVIAARPVIRRVRVRTWMVALVLVAGLVAVGFVIWSQRASIMQPDPDAETLTGRTTLWAASLLKAAEHPILGYGFMAFWNGRRGDYVDVWKMARWAAPNSHNAFIDFTLDLGVVGLVAFVWLCARTCARTFDLQRRREISSIEQVWPATLVVFILLGYLTEGQLVQNNGYWMLFTAAAVLGTRGPLVVASASSHAELAGA